MPETSTTPAGFAPAASADATSVVPLLMPTSTTLRPCVASLAMVSAAVDEDVVTTVRIPAALMRASLRTRKSPGTAPAEPGISTATLAACVALTCTHAMRTMKALRTNDPSLRGAKRRSNPESVAQTGLLRFARNDEGDGYIAI